MPTSEQLMKNLNWQQIVLFLGITFMLLAAVVILALAGKDVATIFGAVGAVVIAVATAFGVNIHNQLGQVKELTNGRMTDVINQNKDLQNQVTALALRLNPSSIPPGNGTTTVTTTTRTDPEITES